MNDEDTKTNKTVTIKVIGLEMEHPIITVAVTTTKVTRTFHRLGCISDAKAMVRNELDGNDYIRNYATAEL